MKLLPTMLLTVLLSVAASFNTYANPAKVNIIPKPVTLEVTGGRSFCLDKATGIYYDKAFRPQAEYLQDLVHHSTGYNLKLKEGTAKKGIVIIRDENITKAESYQLDVTSKAAIIRARDNSGAFYGIQTLLQLLPSEIYSNKLQDNVMWEAPAVHIEDSPERPWRGMMLDVARYFYDKEFVKKYIDMIAAYKMNKLQFHFIDDSGWRLEIKKYPRLTEVGAWAETGTHPMGGFYTQEDIKEIVAYADVRGVEVIPEIEFPAHVLSAVVAYPWLSCSGIQHKIPTQHFISRDLLCVGKESTFEFLRDVMEETIALFPSKYVNIGGDEAFYTQWEKCPKCQRVVRENNLENTAALQGYLTNRMAEMLAEHGKTVVGWEEIILRGKVNTPVISMFWHEVRDTVLATNTGHKGVLIPATHAYFDFPESSTPGEVKSATWMPPISLEKTYSMPINDYSDKSTTLGVQGCFWSDQFIHGTVLQEIPWINENRSEQYCEYLSFPRVIALAEVGWCKESAKDFSDFRSRLSTHYKRLDMKECNYRVPEPIVTNLTSAKEGFTYKLDNAVEGATIHYSTDGTYPTCHSAKYESPVTVTDKNDFRAITVVSPRHFSLPVWTAPDYSAWASFGTYTTSWKSLDIDGQFECTGKINHNGKYQISLVTTRGPKTARFGKLKLYKRDELMAEAMPEGCSDENAAIYEIELTEFEAGTPFYIELDDAKVDNDTAGHIFIKQIQ